MIETAFQIGLYDILPAQAAWVVVGAAFIACRAAAAYQQIEVVYRGKGKSALHNTSFLREAPYYVLLYASGLPILFCLGVQWLAAPCFQFQINASVSGGLWEESGSWDMFGADVPKLFPGYARVLQLLWGATLIAFSLIAAM